VDVFFNSLFLLKSGIQNRKRMAFRNVVTRFIPIVPDSWGSQGELFMFLWLGQRQVPISFENACIDRIRMWRSKTSNIYIYIFGAKLKN
jgi:hypothetical protein